MVPWQSHRKCFGGRRGKHCIDLKGPLRGHLKNDFLNSKDLEGRSLGRLSGRRVTKTWRQEMVGEYVGTPQDGSLPGQILQVGPVGTWAPQLQALLTLAAWCSGPSVGSPLGRLWEEVEATLWSPRPAVSLPSSDFPGTGSTANLCPQSTPGCLPGASTS